MSLCLTEPCHNKFGEAFFSLFYSYRKFQFYNMHFTHLCNNNFLLLRGIKPHGIRFVLTEHVFLSGTFWARFIPWSLGDAGLYICWLEFKTWKSQNLYNNHMSGPLYYSMCMHLSMIFTLPFSGNEDTYKWCNRFPWNINLQTYCHWTTIIWQFETHDFRSSSLTFMLPIPYHPLHAH